MPINICEVCGGRAKSNLCFFHNPESKQKARETSRRAYIAKKEKYAEAGRNYYIEHKEEIKQRKNLKEEYAKKYEQLLLSGALEKLNLIDSSSNQSPTQVQNHNQNQNVVQ